MALVFEKLAGCEISMPSSAQPTCGTGCGEPATHRASWDDGRTWLYLCAAHAPIVEDDEEAAVISKSPGEIAKADDIRQAAQSQARQEAQLQAQMRLFSCLFGAIPFRRPSVLTGDAPAAQGEADEPVVVEGKGGGA